MRQGGGDRLAEGALVFVVGIGMQQANRDGVDRQRLQRRHQPGNFAVFQRHDHGAVMGHAFAHLEPPLAWNQGRRHDGSEIVEPRPRMAAQRQHVAKSLGGHQRRARAAHLDEGVGADGGAVEHRAGTPWRALGEPVDAGDRSDRRVAWRRQDLGAGDDASAPEVEGEDVGERPAHVDAERYVVGIWVGHADRCPAWSRLPRPCSAGSRSASASSRRSMCLRRLTLTRR